MLVKQYVLIPFEIVVLIKKVKTCIKFKELDKTVIESLMISFMNTMYNNIGDVRDFIIRKVLALA